MINNFKSKTWQNSACNLEDFKKVNVNNFHNFNTIAGLYAPPSPFIYNKKLKPNLVGKLKFLLQNIHKFKKINELKEQVRDLWINLPNELKSFFPEANINHSSWLNLEHNSITYKVNGLYLKCAKQAYNLMKYCGDFSNLNILEIGGGYGTMAEIMMNKGSKNYLICDLEETLNLAELYLKYFTKYKILKINSSDEFDKIKLDKDEKNIFLCGVKNFFQLKENIKFDIIINSCSFCEMDQEMLNQYLNKISYYKDSLISCSNRNRKEGATNYRSNFWEFDNRFLVKEIIKNKELNSRGELFSLPQYICKIK